MIKFYCLSLLLLGCAVENTDYVADDAGVYSATYTYPQRIYTINADACLGNRGLALLNRAESMWSLFNVRFEHNDQGVHVYCADNDEDWIGQSDKTGIRIKNAYMTEHNDDDVVVVMVHEIAHRLLKMEHVSDPAAIMYFEVNEGYTFTAADIAEFERINP